MNFTSVHFLCFFPFVVLCYYCLPLKLRWIWLLVSSYYFYMCWNPVYALLMLTSTFITYLCGIFIDSIRNAKSGDTSRKNIEKTIVIAGLCINLLILFFFKYFNFFNESFQYVWNSLGMSWKMNNFDLILPV